MFQLPVWCQRVWCQLQFSGCIWTEKAPTSQHLALRNMTNIEQISLLGKRHSDASWLHLRPCHVGILSKLKHFLPMYIMNTLYYSLILSHLQYCTLLWANTAHALTSLEYYRKKAIRIITQSHYLARTDPLFSKLKLLKLDDRYKHQLGIYMYKSTKGLLPDSMSSMIIPIHNVHNHNLRNQNAYYIQHVRTNCRKFTIHYTGPIFWNTLPQQLREAVSENQFKRKLKEFLLIQQYYFTH